MFRHPAAPAPNATKVMPIMALIISILELEVKRPTAHVNITRDITLGFINRYKDLIWLTNGKVTVLFLIILDKTNLRLLKRI